MGMLGDPVSKCCCHLFGYRLNSHNQRSRMKDWILHCDDVEKSQLCTVQYIDRLPIATCFLSGTLSKSFNPCLGHFMGHGNRPPRLICLQSRYSSGNPICLPSDVHISNFDRSVDSAFALRPEIRHARSDGIREIRRLDMVNITARITLMMGAIVVIFVLKNWSYENQ